MADGGTKRAVITLDLLKVLKKKAKSAPAISLEEKKKQRQTRLTKSDAVLAIRLEVESMLKEKNYSYRDVARWMTQNGCPITPKQVSDALKKAGGADGLGQNLRVEGTGIADAREATGTGASR